MRRGAIFNEEKVLYFAAQESAFHVQPDEGRNTDARRLVNELKGKGHLRLKSDCGAGEFYEITSSGRVRLLELQIKWRLARGKDVSQHEKELRALNQGKGGKA